ncbi:MAG TPA: efflux RND transporter periplasmic adaptor subunit [Cyclobacteriaceae bacterium]|nr:efflux RND transporter periplasmic adaptor subunit [Cyclobacteriaceae bacterium]
MNKLSIIFLFIAALCGCTKNKLNSSSPNTTDSVEVFILKKEPVIKTLSLPAELLPWERAEIYAKVEGYLRELKVDIGDRVRRNDIMLIIDAPEIAANYARALADLQAAGARYRTSTDTYERTLNAAKEIGAVSENELERWRNQMLSDSANYQASRSGANAYAQMNSYLVIRAAFDGTVTQRNVDPGTLVGRAPKPMLILENLSKLRLRIAIPETYTSSLPESNSITFTVDAQPTKNYMAVFSRKANQIDLKTRTELWEFEVENADRELKSGMYGNATVKLQRGESSFVIPYSSLVTNLERNFVIRIREGKPEWVDVKNGIALENKIEIFGPLQEGDLLILKANDEIKPGMEIYALTSNK